MDLNQNKLNKFAVSNHIALILGVQTLRSYLRPTYEYEFHTYQIKKLVFRKHHGENYMKVRRPVVHHLLRNPLLSLRYESGIYYR